MSKMNRPINYILKYIGGICLLISIFWASLTVIYCIPTDWVKENIIASAQELEAEGTYPMHYASLNECV